MNKYGLVRISVLFTTLLLSACGGGSSDLPIVSSEELGEAISAGEIAAPDTVESVSVPDTTGIAITDNGGLAVSDALAAAEAGNGSVNSVESAAERVESDPQLGAANAESDAVVEVAEPAVVEAIEPEPVQPEVVAVEVVEPEPVQPEVVEPEPVQPEVVEPEPVQPEVVEPEPVQPEVVEPEPVQPEVVEPEVVEPEPVQPEVVEPEPVQPEVVEPEPVQPEVVEPEPVQPEVVEPEPAEPVTEDSGVAESQSNESVPEIPLAESAETIPDTTKDEPLPAIVDASVALLETQSALSGSDDNQGAPVPGYLDTLDGDFANVTLTRVSDNTAFEANNGEAVHQYSKRQVWNSNQTLMDVGNKILDAETFEIVKQFVPLSSRRNWSSTNPDIMFGIHYNPDPNELAKYNVATGEITVLRTFSDFRTCSIGEGEGSVSIDDSKVLLVCSNGGGKTLVSYNLQTDTILGTRSADSNLNWGSFSRSGEYILVENNSSANPVRELLRFAPDLTERHLLTNRVEHGDIGVDVNGEDVYVMISWDWLYYVRLRDGAMVNLSISDPKNNLIGNGHVSCRNFNRPGWCFFTAHKTDRVGAAKIGMVSEDDFFTDNEDRRVLRGLGEVEHWGYHRSTRSSYEAQPKGSASPDGRKIIFSSDWYGEGEINDYLLELR